MFIFKLSPVSFRFFFILERGGGGSVYALKELIAFFLWTTRPTYISKQCMYIRDVKETKFIIIFHIKL